MGMAATQGIKELALAWLVLDITSSLAQLGIVIFMQGLPMAVVALFGGVLADRYDRRKLLVYSQLLTTLNLLVLAGLTVTSKVELWHLYASSISLGVTQAITMPARQAFIGNLVDRQDIPNAVALNTMQMHASRIVWPSVAGVMISLLGIGWTFVATGATSAIAIVALWFIHVPKGAHTRRQASPVHQLTEGLRYTWATPVVAGVLTLGFVVGALGQSFMRMAPGFARQELEMNAAQAGLYLMAGGIGSVAASIVFVTFNVGQKNRLYLGSCIAMGVTLIGLALVPGRAAAFAMMLLYGVVQSMWLLLAHTIFQMAVPSRFLGRVVSLWGAAGGTISMTTLLLGIVGEAYGLRVATGGAAVLLPSKFLSRETSSGR
jgi:predicted MFS family arabinose efflux permease